MRQHGGGGGKSKHRSSTSASPRDSSASRLSDANSKKVNHLIDSECRAVPHRKKGASYSDALTALGGADGDTHDTAPEVKDKKVRGRTSRLLSVEELWVGSSSSGRFSSQNASIKSESDPSDAVKEREKHDLLVNSPRRLQGATAEGLDERVNGLVLVPFWAGTAKASGGNSHSEASSEAKHQQAAGTVSQSIFLCSSLGYFYSKSHSLGFRATVYDTPTLRVNLAYEHTSSLKFTFL